MSMERRDGLALLAKWQRGGRLEGRRRAGVCLLALGLLVLACAEPRYEKGPPRDASVAGEDGRVLEALDAPAASDGGTAVDGSAPDAGGAELPEAALPEAGLADAAQATDRDAGSAPASSDAATASDAAAAAAVLPSWGEPLLGTYAVQSHSFAQGATIWSTMEELSLVEVVRDGDGAEMRSRLCSQFAASTEDDVRLLDTTASGLPEIRRKVYFGDGTWWTDAEPRGIGYDRPVPDDCVGKENARIAARSEQVWLTGGSCRCPNTPELPPRSDDCRVRDPDGDGKPGLTYLQRIHFPVPFSYELSAVHVSRTHMVKGQVRAEGAHYAELFVDEVAYQLACVEPCVNLAATSRPCTSENNPVHFRRLEPRGDGKPWTCELLLAQRATLFPDPTPAVPSACTKQVLTDDPDRE